MHEFARKIVRSFYFFASLSLAACGGSNSATAPASGVAVTGSVAAPSASASAGKQTTLQSIVKRTLAAASGTQTNTSAPGTLAVGAGVTVNLIQIDNTGIQVGGVIATSTTDSSGNYTLTAPAGFTPGPTYVVQAALSGSTLQAFVTSTTANVDPYTQTTVALVTGSVVASGGSLATVSAKDITTIQQTVLANSGNITVSSTTTAAQMTAALQQTVKNDVETNNVVSSIAAQGSITGTVVDATGNPVTGIQMLVRRFGDQSTMAMTRTGADGTYSVHVPAGDYIVGAMNDGTASTAASQWWTAAGTGATSMFKASKVSVAAAAVTTNFNLPAGGRLSGTITASDTGLPLAGIQVSLCDFASGQTLMFVKTLPDGTMTFNVPAGDYYLSARNNTLQPYATTEIGGGSNKTQAQKITVAAGSAQNGAMALLPGYQISGTVSDPIANAPVTGIPVRFQDNSAGGAGAEAVRTAMDGTYHMWVKPGMYNVITRGQNALVDVTTASATQDFSAAVGQITAVLRDPSGNPLSQVNVYLYDNSGTTPTLNMVSFEISNSDGTVTVYTTTQSSVKLGFTVDDGEMIGSAVYTSSGSATLSSIANGSPIAVPTAGTTTALGNIALPNGTILTGIVKKGGNPAPNTMIQVRVGGRGGGARLLNVRTMVDGSYQVSLPANSTITRVCAFDVNTSCPNTGSGSGTGSNYAFFDAIAMTATGTTVRQDFAY